MNDMQELMTVLNLLGPVLEGGLAVGSFLLIRTDRHWDTLLLCIGSVTSFLFQMMYSFIGAGVGSTTGLYAMYLGTTLFAIGFLGYGIRKSSGPLVPSQQP